MKAVDALSHVAPKLVALEDVAGDFALTVPCGAVCIEDAVAKQLDKLLVHDLSLLTMLASILSNK